MTNLSSLSGLLTPICYRSFVIGHLTHRRHYLGGREKKCIAGFQPAKVVLTQKELSRLRCRRDAGATIFSHDLRLCGEILFGCGSAALCSSVVSFCAVYADVQGAIPSSIQRLKSARRSSGHLSSQG